MAAQSASPINVATFVEVLKRSQLIDAAKLPRVLNAIAALTQENRSADIIAEHLVTGGHITRWQAAQLLRGKYRGFLMGKYCFRKPLGRGGMGVVFEAEHVVLGTRVAVKVLPTERNDAEKAVSRFLAEARAAAKLNHPNILRVHDCDVVDGKRFMVMDLIEGSNLGELVERNGPLSYRNAIDLLRQAASGLDFAHENGVIHRDVKPHNFMVDKSGQLKVADLGLALFQMDTPDRHTGDGGSSSVLGTVDYVAPEQAWDSRKVDRRADMYSLGCTLYFMLTGKPPFGSGTLAQRLAKHQSSQATPLQQIRRDCPAPIAKLCDKMMAKKPSERIQRMKEVVGICDALLPKLGGNSDLATLASQAGAKKTSGDSQWNSLEAGNHDDTDFESFISSEGDRSTGGGSLANMDFSFLGEALPPVASMPSVDNSYWQQAANAKPAQQPKVLTAKEKEARAVARRNQVLLFVGLGIATLSVILTLWQALTPPKKEDNKSNVRIYEDGDKTIILAPK